MKKWTIILKSGTPIQGASDDDKNIAQMWREWLGNPNKRDTDTLNMGDDYETSILVCEIAAIVHTS